MEVVESSLVKTFGPDPQSCSCEFDREFTGTASLSDVPTDQGWWAWQHSLAAMFETFVHGPLHTVVVDQPSATESQVQLLVGHRLARIEVWGNADPHGDGFGAPVEEFLEGMDFRRPDTASGGSRWWRVFVDTNAFELATVVSNLARDGIELSENEEIRVGVFGAESPCVGCAPFVLGGTDDFCVLCDSAVVEIVYGMPGSELFEAAERGEVVLGGCCLPPFDEAMVTHSCQCGRMTASSTTP